LQKRDFADRSKKAAINGNKPRAVNENNGAAYDKR
jgi:hypothetical protein